ncbi:hypothetical protein CPB83DRAFT_885198 [Crepidotus variabilis]|uniref:Uncharacterized protein n=1 Tax=Crepidotus variabilis TaxID=179855 RepID=A0A9P6JM96_9AGAR|nr:hypothetical protein CPB83DRAFT_885198 [Crepidotus variabilis]
MRFSALLSYVILAGSIAATSAAPTPRSILSEREVANIVDQILLERGLVDGADVDSLYIRSGRGAPRRVPPPSQEGPRGPPTSPRSGRPIPQPPIPNSIIRSKLRRELNDESEVFARSGKGAPGPIPPPSQEGPRGPPTSPRSGRPFPPPPIPNSIIRSKLRRELNDEAELFARSGRGAPGQVPPPSQEGPRGPPTSPRSGRPIPQPPIPNSIIRSKLRRELDDGIYARSGRGAPGQVPPPSQEGPRGPPTSPRSGRPIPQPPIPNSIIRSKLRRELNEESEVFARSGRGAQGAVPPPSQEGPRGPPTSPRSGRPIPQPPIPNSIIRSKLRREVYDEYDI